MKTKLKLIAALLLLSTINHPLSTAFAQGTTFTYQGRLNDGSSPANGLYDFTFSLYDSGGILGIPHLGSGVPVSNGLFTVTLDFGPGSFPGANRWLQIGVRTNGLSSFVPLSPPQMLTATPYAITAGDVTSANIARLNVPNTTIQATGVPTVNFGFLVNAMVTGGGSGYTAAPTVTVNDVSGSGAVITSTISDGVVVNLTVQNPGSGYSAGAALTIAPPASNAYQTFPGENYFTGTNTMSNPANTFIGSFTGNGAGLTGLWNVSGNAGTTPGVNFLGTTDNQPLELRVNGARAMRLEPNTGGAPNVIGGSPNNIVDAGVVSAFIGGGGAINYLGFSSTNRVSANFGTIGGGSGNTIQTNTMGTYAPSSTIGGGADNTIQTNALVSTIAGGDGNTIQAGNVFGTIGGGLQNTIQTVAGQPANYATIAGGQSNTNGGLWAMIPGGRQNIAMGNFSFAAGNQAQAMHEGAFVWADHSDLTPFASTTANQVSFRCAGGVRFTSPGSSGIQTVAWTPGSASWSFSSDRNLKDRFSIVNVQSILDKVSRLPLAEWSYKGYEQRHIGPMAQDFHALFPLNDNDKMLDDADLHGVALAAIQGLNQKLNEKDSEIQDLKQSVAELKKLVQSLAEKK